MIIALTLSLLSSPVLADQMANPYSAYDPVGTNKDFGYPVVTNLNTEGDPCLNPTAQSEWGNKCVCERQKAKVDWAKSEGKTLNDFNWSEIRSKQIVLIGDEHVKLNQDAILNLMARSRSTTGKQCAFFEFSSDYTKDQFMELLNTRDENPETNVYRRYFRRIVEGADGMGFEIHNVDHPGNYRAQDKDPTDEEREAHEIETIHNLFTDKKCDHAVFFVGKNHIAKELFGQDNMTDQLRKGGLSLTRLNPMMARDPLKSTIAGGWNNLCEAQRFTPKEALIFSNSGIAKDFLIPGISFPSTLMRYGSFDYTILFPDPWFDGKAE